IIWTRPLSCGARPARLRCVPVNPHVQATAVGGRLQRELRGRIAGVDDRTGNGIHHPAAGAAQGRGVPATARGFLVVIAGSRVGEQRVPAQVSLALPTLLDVAVGHGDAGTRVVGDDVDILSVPPEDGILDRDPRVFLDVDTVAAVVPGIGVVGN